MALAAFRKEKTMSAEDNKRLARQFFAEVDKKSVDGLGEYLAPGFLAHPPGVPQPLNGEMFQQMLASFSAGFPDYSHTIESQVAEGNKVVCRVSFQGTQTGNFQGIPPTGKPVSISEIHVMRLEDNRIAEYWAVFDSLGMLQQLGLAPGPGQ